MFRNKKSWFLAAIIALASCYQSATAATSTVAINSTSYTQVAGPGAVQAWVSLFRAGQYCFSITQPLATANCHHVDINIDVPLTTMASGVYMWAKADNGQTVAAITTSSDATLGGSSGGGGGGDATAANQLLEIGHLASIDTNIAGSVQGNGTLGVNLTSVGGGIALSTNSGTYGTGTIRVVLATNGNQATSANQTTEITALGTINTTLGTPLQEGGSISVSASALPTGAATDAAISGGFSLADLGDLLSSGGNSALNIEKLNGNTVDTNSGGSGQGTIRTIEASDSAVNTSLTSILTALGAPLQSGGNVVVTSAPTTAVTGTFWQATQPVSASALPLPTGASTSANQTTSNTSLSTIATNTTNGLAATSASQSFSLSKDALTDISGTITTGGTSQSLRSATPGDKSIEIYNNDSTEPLCFIYGTTATLTSAGSYCIPALGYYSNTVNNQAMAIIATTTGHKFTATIRQ